MTFGAGDDHWHAELTMKPEEASAMAGALHRAVATAIRGDEVREDPREQRIFDAMQALSAHVWEVAEMSSHRPENVHYWTEMWLDANARWNLCAPIVDALFPGDAE
jgi:hypothetical protein